MKPLIVCPVMNQLVVRVTTVYCACVSITRLYSRACFALQIYLLILVSTAEAEIDPSADMLSGLLMNANPCDLRACPPVWPCLLMCTTQVLAKWTR